jgi:hypothetical protein
MEAVLDAAEAGGETLVNALDGLALAYGDAQPFLKSIGIETGPLSPDPPFHFRA